MRPLKKILPLTSKSGLQNSMGTPQNLPPSKFLILPCPECKNNSITTSSAKEKTFLCAARGQYLTILNFKTSDFSFTAHGVGPVVGVLGYGAGFVSSLRSQVIFS